ncbi:MAG: bifunctional DNA-formamidopyrimidine glycosylase/DNA-(apurinic or apyrimidinic site) lyase [Nitrospiraceae bacterium]
MPELPEAEIVARQLRAKLIGATLTDSWVGRRDIVREGADTLPWYQGAILQQIHRYGKSVAMELVKGEESRYIVAELGMTGLLLFRSVPIKYPQHVHVRLSFADGQEPELRYWNPRRFGRLSLLDRKGLDRYLARRFGCDPLSVSRQHFMQILRERRGRLKPLLMRQQVIAGIGNIYANEILFRVGLHPHRETSRIRDATRMKLYDTMQTVLREAIADGGSSVRDFFAPDGSEGRYKRYHLAYGKEGHPCPNGCGRVIRRLQGERSSFFCPHCQSKKVSG